MAYEQRDNSGRLWPNNKRTSENSPHLTGNGKYEGKEMRIAAWFVKEGSDEISLAFTPKDAVQQQRPARTTPPLFHKPPQKPTTPPEQYPEHKMRDKTYKPVAEPKPDDTFDPDDIPF